MDLNHLEKGQILHLATGRILTQGELLDYLSRYPVVYIGETHDNLDDHEVELIILKGLYERLDGEVALGLEMLSNDAQKMADAYIQGELEEKAFRNLWVRNWGHNFPYYQDILHFARDNKVPLLALNTDDDIKKAVRDHALDELDPEIASRVPDMDLEDPYYRASALSILEGHPMGNPDKDKFLRIQALWDETMAQTAADYLKSEEGKGKHLIVIAGGHHVRFGFGIPRRLFRRTALPFAIVHSVTVEMPEDKKDRLMDVDPPALPLVPADIYWAVGYRDLDDLKEENPEKTED